MFIYEAKNHPFFISDSMDIMSIPTSKATQLIIGALQACENTSESSFNAILISGYPRNVNDIKEYMEKVSWLSLLIIKG